MFTRRRGAKIERWPDAAEGGRNRRPQCHATASVLLPVKDFDGAREGHVLLHAAAHCLQARVAGARSQPRYSRTKIGAGASAVATNVGASCARGGIGSHPVRYRRAGAGQRTVRALKHAAVVATVPRRRQERRRADADAGADAEVTVAVAAAALGTVKHGEAAILAQDSSRCGRGTAVWGEFFGCRLVRAVTNLVKDFVVQ